MDKRRALKNEFLMSYFGIRTSPLRGVPAAISHEIRSLKTLIVDTPHLTNGYQTHDTSWTLADSTVLPEDIAYRATTASRHLLMKGLHDALINHRDEPVDPAATGSETVEWSSWYHGEHFELDMAGSVEEVMAYCDLTENEREQIVIEARSRAHGGHMVYAVAHGTSSDPTPKPADLRFVGLVVTTLHITSGTLAALSQLRSYGTEVIYMTNEPEDIATHVADAAHMTAHPKIARHAKYASDLGHLVYARIDRVNARRIIAQLPKPLLVARHPVAEFARMLDACR